MGDFEQQTNPAFPEGGAGESSEPIGSVAGGHENLTSDAEHRAYDEAFSDLNGTGGGTMHGWVKKLGVVVVVGLFVWVCVMGWPSGWDRAGTSTAPPTDERGAAEVIAVSSDEAESGLERAVYGDRPSATRQDGTESQAFGNQPDAFPVRRTADGGWSERSGRSPSEFGDRSSGIPQSEPEPVAEPPEFDVASGILPGDEQRRLPEGNQTGFGPAGSRSTSFGPRSPIATDETTLVEAGRTSAVSAFPASSSAANPDLAFSAPTNVAASGQGNRDLPFEASPSADSPRTLDSTTAARPIVGGSRSTFTFGDRGEPGDGAATGVHEVAAGDSYWAISRRYYGTARYFQALAKYNSHRIRDPQRMRPGMKVLVPRRELLESQFGNLVPQGGNARSSEMVGFSLSHEGNPVYRVGSGDTLTGIAEKYLGRTSRWIQIYRLNRRELPSPHKLIQGMVLRMPADAARVQLIPEADTGR